MTRPNGKLDLSERLEILERDNFHCTGCGVGGKNSDWILEVHHKNGKGSDHRPSNLTTLCVRCHNNKHPFRWANPKYRIFKFSERRNR